MPMLYAFYGVIGGLAIRVYEWVEMCIPVAGTA